MQMEKAPSVMSDYCLDRLFDPEELYYTPMEELLKRYKKRDLLPGKFYNIASKYLLAPLTRKRVITAPPMEKLHHRYSDPNNFYKPPVKVYYCSHQALNKNEEIRDDPSIDTSNTKNEVYEKWLDNRKKVRHDLTNMGLNLEYLKRKKDLSELEKRVLRRMMFIDQQTQTEEIKEKKKLLKNIIKPKIILPTPIAMQKIEESLDKERWRLVDLFQDLDKNKDGKLQGSDFQRECDRLGITDAMLDELLMTYGNINKKIKYKELARGRTELSIDRRNLLRESSNVQINQTSTTIPKNTSFKLNNTTDSIKEPSKQQSVFLNSTHENDTTKRNEKIKRQSSSVSKSSAYSSSFNSTNTSSLLKAPSIDSREGFYPTEHNTEHRGTSAPAFYTVKTATNLPTSKTKDKMEVSEMLAEFRNKVKMDNENLKSVTKINLNEKQMSGFEYPKETERAKIISGILDKQKQERERIILEAKLEWERKRREIKEKLRKEKMS